MDTNWEKSRKIANELNGIFQGGTVTEAVEYIKKIYPEYRIVIIGPNSMITADMDYNRIRISLNEDGFVNMIRVGN